MRSLLLLLILCSCASQPYYAGEESDHFNGERFASQKPPPSFLEDLKFAFSKKTSWKKSDEAALDAFPHLNKEIKRARLIFIGHSTFLIQLPNLNILTDPIWSDRAGPIALPGFSKKRHHDAALKISELPKIDVVFISHNSYYHMDLPTIKKLHAAFAPQFITGLGNCHYLNDVKKLNLNCAELDWQQRFVASDGSEFFFLPTKGWSKRSYFDTNKTLWGSLLIRNSRIKIYFAGDTGFDKHLSEIGNKFAPIDVALLPIGAYEPRWYLQDYHMNPSDAVKAHFALHAKKSIGMHFNTFQTTAEGYLDVENDLAIARNSHHLKEQDFIAPQFGEVFNF